MRSDYALYVVAVIFFLITAIGAYILVDPERLWILSTAVLGLLFLGLGYTQKPRTKAITIQAPAPTPAITAPAPAVEPVKEVVKEKTAELIMKAEPAKKGLTEIRGINEKRAEQLKTMGIHSIEDLAKAAPTDLAAKLSVSPKITTMWIGQAKKRTAKS